MSASPAVTSSGIPAVSKTTDTTQLHGPADRELPSGHSCGDRVARRGREALVILLL